jgi:hypothetical protein
MADVQIIGYHTCKTDGGWSYINSEAPFLSGSGDNQWLTQGYYFWTDSSHFAHKWGKDSYNNDYSIIECKLIMDVEKLFDTVGSTKAQLYFEKLLIRFRNKLKKIDPKREPTVQSVIDYWRKEAKKNIEIFPFLAIKAQDGFRGSRISFSGGVEKMQVGIQSQQLCLFENGLHLLQEKKIIYPPNFIKDN